MTSKTQTQILLTALKTVIQSGQVGTQQEICTALAKQGFVVNQSKISRLIRALHVIKLPAMEGKTVYHLPSEQAPPSTESALAHLVLEITANESLVVVRTSSGSAGLLARLLDYRSANSYILATIAGDDTIFVAPRSIHHIQETWQEVKQLLSEAGSSNT